jgi:hypothetical protein
MPCYNFRTLRLVTFNHTSSMRPRGCLVAVWTTGCLVSKLRLNLMYSIIISHILLLRFLDASTITSRGRMLVSSWLDFLLRHNLSNSIRIFPSYTLTMGLRGILVAACSAWWSRNPFDFQGALTYTSPSFSSATVASRGRILGWSVGKIYFISKLTNLYL